MVPQAAALVVPQAAALVVPQAAALVVPQAENSVTFSLFKGYLFIWRLFCSV